MAEDFGGTGTSYQRYRCDLATPDVPVAIDGAATASYTPTENGIYYVAVTGGNVRYNPYAAELTVWRFYKIIRNFSWLRMIFEI